MRFAKGFSIVELMVALLLGTLISIAATQLFLVNRQSENLQQGVAFVQDQGRFVLDYVGRDIMQAGKGATDAVQPFIFSVSDTPSATCNNVLYSCDTTQYDVLVINVEDGFDCMGTPGFTGLKRYRVKDKGLICGYWKELADGTTQYQSAGELVDGVEAFQVLYGVDYDDVSSSGYGQADIYTDALGARTAVAADSGKRIVSARIAVLIASPAVVTREADIAPTSIFVLDQTYSSSAPISLADGRLYRVFTGTVAIRNLADPG